MGQATLAYPLLPPPGASCAINCIYHLVNVLYEIFQQALLTLHSNKSNKNKYFLDSPQTDLALEIENLNQRNNPV